MAPAPARGSRSRSPEPSEGTFLVVDDEPAIVEVLEAALRVRGYGVRVARDAREALQIASATEPDLYIIDLGLPDLDGVELCRRLRRWTTNPIIVLTVDDGEDRKVEALDAGADDYVAKPFSMPELLARIRVAQRHLDVLTQLGPTGAVHAGALTVDVAAHVVTVDGRQLALAPKEFAVLALLVVNQGRVVPHRLLVLAAWSDSDPRRGEKLRTHINQLRRKLGGARSRIEIANEHGVGYRLVVAPDELTSARTGTGNGAPRVPR